MINYYFMYIFYKYIQYCKTSGNVGISRFWRDLQCEGCVHTHVQICTHTYTRANIKHVRTQHNDTHEQTATTRTDTATARANKQQRHEARTDTATTRASKHQRHAARTVTATVCANKQ